MSATNEASPAGETGDLERLVRPHCPYCNAETKVTWNWFEHNDNWHHECWKCENVFTTPEEAIEA